MNESNRILKGGRETIASIETSQRVELPSQVEHAKRYEKVKPYDQLGGEPETMRYDGWGNIELDGEWTNYYRDHRIMDRVFTHEISQYLDGRDKGETLMIADLGGADGQLAHHVAEQLEQDGYENAHVLNIDLNEKALAQAYQNYPELKIVRANLLELPLNNESLDVATSRFVLQYFAGKYADQCPVSQQDLLDELYRVTKKDGLVILNYLGARNEAEEEGMARLIAHMSHMTDGADYQSTLYTKGCSTLERVIEFAEKSGFSIVSAGEFESPFYFSAESFANRFNFPEDHREELIARLDAIVRDGAEIGLDVQEVPGREGQTSAAAYGAIMKVVLKK